MRDRARSAFVWMAMAAVLGASLPAAALAKPPGQKIAKKVPAKAAKPEQPPISDEAAQLTGWVVATGDNARMPFAVVDKKGGQVYVYGPDGKLRGQAPALVGLAKGDDSTPGIGDREMSDIRPEERTTPAGRFLAWYGPDADNKKVLWVDYGTAISMHPVVTAHPAERRPQRLRSPSPSDNRITYGCINLPAAFYKQVVDKAFAPKGGVVYVLPDSTPLAEVFPLRQMQASAGPGLGPEEKISASGGRVAVR